MSEAEGSLNPILKLIVENGPLAGQTFNFIPGSKVHVGRIARGNTITIKDAGISSKHFSIQFESHPGRWTVSDMDSSNGTFLNGRALDPFDPAQLADGDVIKVGEVTSILVVVGVEEEERVVRRNPPRRRGRNVAVVDENDELNFGKLKNNEKDRPRNRRGKIVLENREISESRELAQVKEEATEVENLVRKAGLRSTRSKKIVKKLEENEGRVFEGMDKLVTGEVKGAGMEGPSGVSTVKQEKISGVWKNYGYDGFAGLDKEEQNESSKRVTQRMRNREGLKILEDKGFKGRNRVSPGELREREDVSLRRITRSMREDKSLENLGENVGQKNKKTRKGRREKQNVEVQTLGEIVEDVQTEKEDAAVKSNPNADETEDARMDAMPVNEVVEMHEGEAVDGYTEKEIVDLGVKDFRGLASSSGSKDHNGDGVDLEKMTVSQWFDYLEVNLAKEIIDATEQMILDMREKSKRFHEFMLQQKNAKESVTLSMG